MDEGEEFWKKARSHKKADFSVAAKFVVCGANGSKEEGGNDGVTGCWFWEGACFGARGKNERDGKGGHARAFHSIWTLGFHHRSVDMQDISPYICRHHHFEVRLVFCSQFGGQPH